MWAMAAPASEVSQSKWSASAPGDCGIRQALLFRHHQYVAETPPHYNYPTLAAPAREQQLRLDAFPALPCRCPILARKRLGDEPLDLAGLFQLEQISYVPLFCFRHHPLGSPTTVASNEGRPRFHRQAIDVCPELRLRV